MRQTLRLMLLAVSLVASGCVTPVSPIIFEEEGAAPLSKSGCPNLAGRYVNLLNNEGDRFHEYFYALGNLEDRQYLVSTGNRNRDPAAKGKLVRGRSVQTGETREVLTMLYATTSTVRVEQSREVVTLILFDGEGFEWGRKSIRLGTSDDVGCRDEALVMRWKKYASGAEMTSSSQSYGEVILKKEPEGGILLSTWSRSRQYSNLLRVPSPGFGRPLQTWRVKPVIPSK